MNNYSIPNIKTNFCLNKSNNNIQNNINNEINNKELIIKKFNKNNNNLKCFKNKERNNQTRNNNILINEKEKTIFVRRIILEEQYTIDSNGGKKTIFIKKISPFTKRNKNLNSREKNSKKNHKKNILKLKDNTFINHNDINLNFNIVPFQKIRMNNNNSSFNASKLQNNSDNKLNINNDISINESIKNCESNILLK
jgi:hypothetical protein